MLETVIFTYHRMIEGCLRREPAAWREFAANYLPLARHLLSQYLPAPANDRDRLLPQVFAATLEDAGGFFRSFSGRTERELLVHFRNFAVEWLRAREAVTESAAPRLDLQSLESALKDFTALQRQVIWLYGLGYEREQFAPILLMKPETAAETVRAAQEKLRAAMENWSEESLRASMAGLAAAVAGQETKECHPYLTFHRMLDGQITWRDRDAVLAHLARCFRCVDRFSVLQEVVYFAGTLSPATPAEIEALLNQLGLGAAARKKSLFARLFSE